MSLRILLMVFGVTFRNEAMSCNESAMIKMLAFVKSLVPAKKTKTESDWANRFVGAWKDSRSAEEIISDIRESRTANSREFEL